MMVEVKESVQRQKVVLDLSDVLRLRKISEVSYAVPLFSVYSRFELPTYDNLCKSSVCLPLMCIFLIL